MIATATPIAFMCTGSSTGFDPVCDPGDTVALAVIVFIALIVGVVALVRAVRRRRARRTPRREKSHRTTP